MEVDPIIQGGAEENRAREEHQFLRLFRLILDQVISMKGVTDSDIENSIQDIIDSFKERPFSFDNINLRKWENICGYLYRYGSHGAGFARYRVLNALQNCEILRAKFREPDVKIVFLGSGPGNDAIGLFSALYEMRNYLNICGKNIDATIVDKYEEWDLCVEIANDLITRENFGNTTSLFQEANVNLSFIQVDLPGDPEEDKEYFQILEKADIVVLFKFVDILRFRMVDTIIESLRKNVKEGAFILLSRKLKDGNGDWIEMDRRWSEFEFVNSYGNSDAYQSLYSARAARRFGHYDSVQSVLPLSVLRN